MLNEGNFKEKLLDMVNNSTSYTKEQYYEAFLEMTEKYLDELASTLTFEKNIISKCGKEKGERLIEAIAVSNPALSELESQYIFDDHDKKEYINEMLVFTEFEFGYCFDSHDDSDNDEQI